jgi:hypothetical protein
MCNGSAGTLLQAALTSLVDSMHRERQELLIIIASRACLNLNHALATKHLERLSCDEDVAAVLQLYCPSKVNGFTEKEVKDLGAACGCNCLLLKMAACALHNDTVTVEVRHTHLHCCLTNAV